ncbi:MAG TPA: MlaD family protein, partial [Terriglobales bacterium]|nr:MlaD family protein [Terriglobales bacterium]
VIASAVLLIGALYYALKGGSRGRVSFDAAFNEVGGIKEGSSVLFKGMPVGAVGKMRYDAATDKILVRIEITKQVDVPATIKPYVEKSLMGQSNIALRTEQQTGTKELLADVVRRLQAGDKDGLYRIDGVELSRLDAIKPGLDAKSEGAIDDATKTMHRTAELAESSNTALTKARQDLEKVAATLDQAGQAIIRSESHIKKLGSASEKLGSASDNVNGFIQVLKVKPSALVWGLSDQQRTMMNQPQGPRRPSATPVRK